MSACARYASGYRWASGIDDVGVSGGFTGPSDTKACARGGGNGGGGDLEDEASCLTGGVCERAAPLRELRTAGIGVCERDEGGEGKKKGCVGVAFLSTDKGEGEGLADRVSFLGKGTGGVEGLDGWRTGMAITGRESAVPLLGATATKAAVNEVESSNPKLESTLSIGECKLDVA